MHKLIIVLIFLQTIVSPPLHQAFYIHNDSSILSPKEWTERYTCSKENKLHPLECRREPTAWRYKYAYENTNEKFMNLIRESSLEERLANVYYTVQVSSGIETAVHEFNQANQNDTQLLDQVAGSKVDDSRCTADMKSLLRQIEELETKLERKAANPSTDHELLDESEIRLARFLDSFGRYDSGFLNGKDYIFGSYQQCVSTQLSLSSEEDSNRTGSEETLVDSRFCWAKLSLEKYLSESLRNRAKLPGENGARVAIKSGICIPSTCHTRSFLQPENRVLFERLVHSQFDLPKSIFFDRKPKLESIFCLVDEDSVQAQWSTAGLIFLATIAIWLVLVLFVTICRRFDSNKKRGVLDSLDVVESWKDLTCHEELDKKAPERQVDFESLNLLKVIMVPINVLGHTSLITGAIYSNKLDIFTQMRRGRVDLLTLVIYLISDVYFVISGMMIAYFSLKKLDKVAIQDDNSMHKKTDGDRTDKRTKNSLGLVKFWFGLALARYTRLVPLHALAFWFQKSIFVHLGSGPFWDHGLNNQTTLGACMSTESWLTPFSIIPSYGPLSKRCLPTSWTVVNDLLYSCVLIPPVLFLLHRRPKLGLPILASMACYAIYATLSIYETVPDGFKWELEQMNIVTIYLLLSIGSYMRSMPESNFTSYAFGILTGYILYRYSKRMGEQKKISDCKAAWPFWFRHLLTWPVVAMSFGVIVSTVFADYVKQRSSLEDLTGAPKKVHVHNHIIISAACVCVFLQMVTTWRQSPLMRSFSTRIWKSLSKLNYAIVLIHWMILQYDVGITQVYPFYYRQICYKSFCFAYSTSLAFAVLIYVLFECPLEKLVRGQLMKLM